jgi:hypothetical protein
VCLCGRDTASEPTPALVTSVGAAVHATRQTISRYLAQLDAQGTTFPQLFSPLVNLDSADVR